VSSTLRFKIKDPLGLHLRPAKDMAQLFLKSESEIFLHYEEQHANAKSPLSLLTLAAPCDSIMTLELKGEDKHIVMDSFLEKFSEWMVPLND